MNRHVDEQRAEDQQVGAVVDGVLNERRLDLPGDGEPSGASVRLHEGQQQPGNSSTGSEWLQNRPAGESSSGSNPPGEALRGPVHHPPEHGHDAFRDEAPGPVARRPDGPGDGNQRQLPPERQKSSNHRSQRQTDQ